MIIIIISLKDLISHYADKDCFTKGFCTNSVRIYLQRFTNIFTKIDK